MPAVQQLLSWRDILITLLNHNVILEECLFLLCHWLRRHLRRERRLIVTFFFFFNIRSDLHVQLHVYTSLSEMVCELPGVGLFRQNLFPLLVTFILPACCVLIGYNERQVFL